MREIPVVSRTQRRMERRQRLLMLILVAAVVSASFFLGVMVGERSSSSALSRQLEGGYQQAVEVPPPPPAVNQLAGSKRMTFYDDLPKGNAAPLGSGINLPKSGYPTAAPVVAPAPAVVEAPPPQAPRVESAAPAAAEKAAPPPAVPAKAVPPAPAPAKGGAYIIQVSSTKSQADAQRLADKLKGKGFGAYTERVDLGSRGIWYRVVAGSYADRPAADKAAASLRKQGLEADVRKK